MTEEVEAPKRKRGRPKKDPNAPKARYNLSTAEKARRATQASITRSKKEAARKKNAAEKQVYRARQREKAASKVETALQGEKSRVIDQGDLDVLPKAAHLRSCMCITQLLRLCQA